MILIGFVAANANAAGQDERVVVMSSGWELIGDLRIPAENATGAAVLMLNKAAGHRESYAALSGELAERGIASLRLDLRAHGESTNLGKFEPETATEEDRETIIWNAEVDVVAAHQYLQAHPAIDANRIAIVGASYSGEEMAEAGRNTAYAAAYVALSPGSFSPESIDAMDGSGASWLFIVSKYERYLSEIVANVHEKTRNVEILYLPGEQHATRILDHRPDMAERIAIWLERALGEP
jgi:dienelactone hydrolase